MELYKKYRNFIEGALFPFLLFIYPFLGIDQGLDVADSTYSLANFQYFGQMEGTWMVATFLSNATGSLLMKLPFGGTLLGMRCYATLVQSGMALSAYFALWKRMDARLLFLGEILALGLCFAPATILYHYLTYFLMTAGVLFLYLGLMALDQAAGERRLRPWLCFAAAGVCLGANVAVRMPNVVHAAFILVAWYGVTLICKHDNDYKNFLGVVSLENVNKYNHERNSDIEASKRRNVRKGIRAFFDKPDHAQKGHVSPERKRPLPWGLLLRVTGACLFGYCAGFGLPFAAICLRYGSQAYPDMVRTLFAMTDQATDYKPASMLTGMLGDYGTGLHWLAFAGLCVGAGALGLLAWRKAWKRRESRESATGTERADGAEAAFSGKCGRGAGLHKIAHIIIKAAYAVLFVLLLRFYWGRGMFSFRYYDYSSIYYPAVLLLLLTIGAAALCLMRRGEAVEKKILAAAVLLEIFLTPLGSNNALYPIINNLFLAAPFLLWMGFDGAVGLPRRGGFAAAGPEGKAAEDRAALAGEWSAASAFGFLWRLPLTLFFIFLLAQSIGFHGTFAFQDGVWGEPRDMRAAQPKKAAGIWTNRESGTLLAELSRFVEKEGLGGRKLIPYGELPGLPYLLDMPPALSTAWPDLASYRMEEYLRDLEALERDMAAGGEAPVIILSAPVAAFLRGDKEAAAWFGADVAALAADEKLGLLGQLMEKQRYVEAFGNGGYAVFMVK